MKISDVYIYAYCRVRNFWCSLSAPFKFIIALLAAYFSLITIGGAASTGYIWSFRSNILVSNVYGLSPSYYLVLINNFFVPSTIATIGVGMLKLGFRQITKRRTLHTKLLFPVRRFIQRNNFIVWIVVFTISSALIFIPGLLSLYFVCSVFFSVTTLYIAIYAGEFRFSIREILSLKFYRFFSRSGVSKFRKNSARVTWVVAAILSFSFLFGHYEYRAATTRCVSIETSGDKALSLKNRAVILSGDKGLIVSRCEINPWNTMGVAERSLIFIPSSDISYISMY